MTVIAVASSELAETLRQHAGDKLQIVDISAVTTADDLSDAARQAEVLIPGFLAGTSVLDLIGSLPNLKLVQLMTAGAEVWVGKVPDGVTLTTSSGAHGGSTAEWAVGALLAVLHEFPGFVADQQAGHWNRHRTDELAGKRVLVIGAGDLGHNAQRRLTAFDATVTLAGRTARDGVVGIDQVPQLLPDQDVVILMIPLTDASKGLVDKDFLARMPDNAVLVNAARGQIVDTDALLAELNAKRLRAAIDVTDPEPLPDGHPLWSAPNLFITPHIAGAVPGAAARVLDVVLDNLARFADGRELRNVVTAERGY